MRDPRQEAPNPWLAVSAIAGFLLVFTTGCESGMFAPPDAASRQGQTQPLPLGSWTRDSLHCAVARCQRIYRIDLEEPGSLQVDLYAPAGSGLPDCTLMLETEDGQPVDARTGRVQTRRRLHADTGPGTYRLRVVAKGENQGLFDFELVAQLETPPTAGTSSAERRPAPPRRETPPRTPPPGAKPPIPMAKPPIPVATLPSAPPEPQVDEGTGLEAPGEASVPEPEPVWIEAVVLDVEETDGKPSAVMLEAGYPAGVRPGMSGELFDAGREIGRIEVVDVYPSGSRARILGSLSAPISFDTVSRIEITPGQASGESGAGAEN